MGNFIVPKRRKTFSQLLVGEDSCLGQAINGPTDFYVDKTALLMFLEAVLIDGVLGEQANWEFHVLEPIEWPSQIKILDINSHELCILGAEDAVPNDFGCSEVGGAGGKFAGVFDEVASCGHADAVWIFLLWAEVDDDASVSNNAIFWDVLDFVMRHDKDGVCSLFASFVVALGHAAPFLSKCC